MKGADVLELTTVQKQALYEQGFVKLPGIVQRELVDESLRTINASLGSEGMDPQRLATFREQTYCPEIYKTPVIARLLLASPLWSIAEATLGQNTLQEVQGGQIALRFPSLEPARKPVSHIDGIHSPGNGVPEGKIVSFTALVGVFLSDIPHDWMGNFTVWPGTHRLYEQYFRQHGPLSLLEGLPEVEMPEPLQITAKAGDAVLCHYQLAHGIASNVSPFIRYAIFFRLRNKNHNTWNLECMTNIWKEWPGMHDIVSAHAQS